MGFLSGGSRQRSQSQSTSSSRNTAAPFLQGALGQSASNANTTNSAILNLLGLNGEPAQTEGFQNYLDSTGYNFIRDTGSSAITGNQAASGLLNSGSTLKELDRFGQNLGDTYFSSYLDNLFNLNNSSLQSANIISGSGNVSTGQSNSNSSGRSNSGIGSFIGSIGSSIAASDKRLKENITKLGTMSNGLDLYEYTYKSNGLTTVGVMADEVAEILPEALGPMVDGYMTVDYDKVLETL